MHCGPNFLGMCATLSYGHYFHYRHVLPGSSEVHGVAITTSTNVAYEMVKQREGMEGTAEYEEILPIVSPPSASQEYEIPLPPSYQSPPAVPLPAATSSLNPEFSPLEQNKR